MPCDRRRSTLRREVIAMHFVQPVLLAGVMIAVAIIYASLIFPIDQSAAFCFYAQRWVKGLGEDSD